MTMEGSLPQKSLIPRHRSRLLRRPLGSKGLTAITTQTGGPSQSGLGLLGNCYRPAASRQARERRRGSDRNDSEAPSRRRPRSTAYTTWRGSSFTTCQWAYLYPSHRLGPSLLSTISSGPKFFAAEVERGVFVGGKRTRWEGGVHH